MKRFYCCLIVLMSMNISAQFEHIFLDEIPKKDEYKQELDFDFTYNYNETSGSQLFADIRYKNYIAKWVDLELGFHSQTNSTYALLAKANFKWNVKSHHNLELRNQYLYNIFAKSNSQSFNTIIAIAYSQDYCYIALGASSQFFTPIMNASKPAFVYEPIAICYDIEGRIFPKLHKWNLGLQITNITPFLVERQYSPNFIFKGNAQVLETARERIDITFKIGFEPSGIFHIQAQQYELYVGAGIKCSL